MKKLLKALAAVILFSMPNVNYGQAPNLGTSADFVLFTTVGAVTNSGTGFLTHLTGNVGSNSGSSTGFGNVDGGMHDGDAISGGAGTDLLIAYNQLDTTTPTFHPSSALGGGATLVPGVYAIASAATLSGNLILDAAGDPNAVFIFQINGSLSVAANTKVKMINGGLACNVFWKVEGLIGVAAASSLKGTFIAHNAAISLGTLDTLEGRALSINGAVTMNSLMAYTPIGCGSATLTGPTAPTLGAVSTFGLFSSIGPVTNTGAITYVTGDIGTNSGLVTGYNPTYVTGTIHSVPDGATAAAASALATAYTQLNTLAYDIELLYPAQFGNGLVLTPHTYLLNAATALTDTLYLNAEGNRNAIFVIQINGALSTAPGALIKLVNGTQIKNIYWKVEGAVTLGLSSHFYGTVVANNGAIDLGTASKFNGRALTTNGAISTNGDSLTAEVFPSAGPITGDTAVCVGASTTLSGSDTGGVWTASNTHATVAPTTGVVTGVSAGIDTITHILVNRFGTDTATYIVTVKPLPVAGPITGPSTVCIGMSITLAGSDTGGTWSRSNSNATISTAGLVTGVTSGLDTMTYIVTNTCGSDTATKVITVSPVANAGTITGPSAVCTGSTITLTNATTGGTWSATNTHATVAGGVVTGVTSGLDTIRYIVTTACGADTATKTITVNPTANAGTISGPSTVCPGSSITLTDATTGGVWTATNTHATVVGGIVTGVTAGIDTIMYSVTTTCGTAVATHIVTVNTTPAAGTITGPSIVCAGSSITLTDATTGGVWTATNTNATVAGGIVTGVTNGTDTIMYTVTNTCGTAVATKIITVSPGAPSAGTISGPSAVCVASSITLTDGVSGGTWSASNSHATVAGGIVTGITTGIDTISYTVTNSCGTDVATKTVTVNPLPNAGTITGASSVCVASSITLTDAAAGGTWSASNANATVTGSGIVTGITAGIDTISYTVTNGCGTDVATKTVTVNPLPNAGTITGASSVCVASSITLTDAAAGGTWSASNGNATVTGSGIVTGITAGIDTISYTVTNGCGTAITTKTITVNPLPNAGTITGASSVCVASSITLTDAAAGGTWSASNANATVTGSGIVTGITAGIDTLSYTVTNGCGTDVATKTVTVNPLPNAGTITGASSVCVASSITLTDAAAGGTWSASNANATVTASGIVTGITAGIDTISYTVTNGCGTAITTKTITVNPLPNAGTITGASSVCVASSITLTDAAAGGTWSASNANATVTGSGIVTGITAGIDIISYTVTNGCGTAITTKTITVNPLPNAGTIVSPARVCVGDAITATDAVSGGTWSVSNTRATITTTGVITGITAGIDTVMYTYTNVCGTDIATTTIAINALPLLTSTITPAAICDSSVFSYVPVSDSSAATFKWIRPVVIGISNNFDSGTSSISEALMNITNNPVVVTYTYTTSANGCSTNQNITVTVNPTPKLSSTLSTTVCSGQTFNYGATGFTAGTTFGWTRAAVSGITPATNTGSGDVHETLTNSTSAAISIAYVYTLSANGCTFQQRVVVIVNPIPAIPGITINSPSNVCDNTMYQNFGTTAPATGIQYTWTAVNATVYARGTNSQNALINFTNPGTAQVILSSNYIGIPCAVNTSYTVNVSTTTAAIPTVTYFQSHFVCTPNNEGSYQWGYDDVTTLDSTILHGEINQDYVVTTPDFAHKYYWVMTGNGSCMQKTYVNAPLAIQELNATAVTMNIYPNPTENVINVTLNTVMDGKIQFDVINMAGQKITSVTATDNTTTIDVANLPAGIYLIGCFHNGTKVAVTRFTKN